MNIPNKLTVVRVLLVPVFMVFLFLKLPGEHGEMISRLLAAALFGLAAVTDSLDGKIARKFGQITDFGKFLDPLADKFMVFGAIIGFIAADMYREPASLHLAAAICGAIVMFRELAVTSLRLVVSTGGKVVIAANRLGKAKTMTQCMWIVTTILEPVLMGFFPSFWTLPILTWILLVLMTVLTVVSGVSYMKAYWKYLDPTK